MKELLARLFSRPVIAAEIITASLFANILALAMPLFVMQVLRRYVSYGVDTTLATLTVGVIGAIALEFGFRQVRFKLAAAINSRFDEGLAEAAFSILTGAKSAAIDMLPPGLRREIIAGADTIRGAYGPLNIAAVLDVPFALVFLLALALLSPTLALIASLFIILVFAASLVNQWTLRKPVREIMQSSGRRSSLVASAIRAADTVRAFNSAAYIRNEWQGEGQRFHALGRYISARQGLISSMIQSAQALMGVAVIAIGAIRVVAGDFDIGTLIGANILAARALGPIIKFAQLNEAFARAEQSLKMFRGFSKLPRERDKGSALGEYMGGIELRDVAFSHPGSHTPLFESLSLKLEPGATMVVTGANASGKTTMARMLVGLIEPSRGRIAADGVDLGQIAPEWWRRHVIYMPQEPQFINASLRDNLMAFNPSLDDQRLNNLVNTTGLRRLVEENPDGFDFPITDNGASLSLGVRRRLALARGLASDGMLVIMDEPTEGLDAEGCAMVYAVLNGLAKRRRTIIAFSHDPGILKGAQHVLDLNSKPVPKLFNAQSQPNHTAATASTASEPTT